MEMFLGSRSTYDSLLLQPAICPLHFLPLDHSSNCPYSECVECKGSTSTGTKKANKNEMKQR